jgi:hypothetical protein
MHPVCVTPRVTYTNLLARRMPRGIIRALWEVRRGVMTGVERTSFVP